MKRLTVLCMLVFAVTRAAQAAKTYEECLVPGYSTFGFTIWGRTAPNPIPDLRTNLVPQQLEISTGVFMDTMYGIPAGTAPDRLGGDTVSRQQYWATFMAFQQLAGVAKLQAALLELRDRDFVEFDRIFRSYGLHLREIPPQPSSNPRSNQKGK